MLAPRAPGDGEPSNADHGLTLFICAAEPGSRSEEALNLLGSWAATNDAAAPVQTTGRG